MNTGSAKGEQQKKSDIDELINQAKATSRKQSTTAKAGESREEAPFSAKFAKMDQNTFYKIMFDTETTPQEKMQCVSKALTYSEDKDAAKQRLEEFKNFKEYLQYERKRMAQQIIQLTDTEAFAELKEVYDELNSALVDFEDKINPLTDIVDAVYQLRMNGVTFDAFREITVDKEAEARIAALRAEHEEKLKTLEGQIRDTHSRIAEWSENKVFFGLGGIAEDSRKKIARGQLLLQDLDRQLNKLTTEMKNPDAYAMPKSQLDAKFLDSKTKLRQLLDISSDEHKNRQMDLVKAAQHFVNTTEVRVSSISGHFGQMDQQIDNLLEANYSMREIYAILNDSTKDAHIKNETHRDTLQTDPETASDIEKMNREREKRDLENYIGSLGASAVDTTAVFAELTNAGHRIKSMKDGNDQQITKTRQIHSSGVASVADQLSTVLQAVSAAALGESSEMARMSLERMNTKTSDLSQKEVIRIALGTHEQNKDLTKALEDLEQYGEIIRTATSITREGLQETKSLLGMLEEKAKAVQEDVKKSISVAAEVVAGEGGGDDEDSAQDAGAVTPNPFKI